jgi:hypothetical protein
MRGNDPTGYLQKPSRRRILTLSAGALATGLAGCSAVNLGETSGLTSSDQTALEAYSDSYETVQEAKDKYESGIETFRENVGTNGRIEDYPSDWPEFQNQMITAEEVFTTASDGFNQARRSATSEIIESECREAVAWIEPHTELAGFFRQAGGPPERIVDEYEQEISEFTPPTPPEELRNEVTG